MLRCRFLRYAVPLLLGAASCVSATPSLDLDADPRPVRQANSAPGAPDAEELAKKLANPAAELISFPLQFNYDEDIGPGDAGERLQVNLQPVVPIVLNERWKVLSRTILPVLDQHDIPPGNDESGIGDITESLFLSPRKEKGGLHWGAGPVFLIPSASDETLGTEKWGAGPTGLILVQQGSLTVGALANHIWSFAGDDDRPVVSSTFLQPFVSHTTPTAWTFTLNSESTYDWRREDWSVPINAIASKVLHLGKLPVSVGCGGRYWLEHAEGDPEGFGLRFVITFLLPE